MLWRELNNTTLQLAAGGKIEKIISDRQTETSPREILHLKISTLSYEQIYSFKIMKIRYINYYCIFTLMDPIYLALVRLVWTS